MTDPCIPCPHTTDSCKNTDAELPFLYEDHERFAAFPTFPLVLPFKGTSHDVVPFPSPTLFSFPPGTRANCMSVAGWLCLPTYMHVHLYKECTIKTQQASPS